MDLPTISEILIRQHATPESFARGQTYYREGAVVSRVLRGNTLQADVEGSQFTPYRVSITFDEGGSVEAGCSCPYDWGGWCKHIIAALLVCVHEPDTIEIRPSLEETFSHLEKEELTGLLISLVKRYPDLPEDVEGHVALLSSSAGDSHPSQTATSPPRRTSVDAKSYRRQVRMILHSLDHMRPSEAYWQVNNVVDQVRSLLSEAQRFTEAGDGENALVLLEAVTDEYVDGWFHLDDSDGFAGGFFEELGQAWIEAILTTESSSAEWQQLLEKFDQWGAKIDDYGIDDVFDAARAAASLGWDYPPLQQVLEGEITDLGAWQSEAPWYADELALARLNVLERQGRFREYLNLAQAEGQTEEYFTMLVRLGHIRQAEDEGLQQLATADQAHVLAKALRDAGEMTAALHIAEYGLTLEGWHRASLAAWTRDLAAAGGNMALARQAAETAFRQSPSLNDYLSLQELAGEEWAQLRTDMLTLLRQEAGYAHVQGAVDVFLHEGLVDDAIGVVEQQQGSHGVSYDLLEQVADAAIQQRPDWVIQSARRQAERIMDAGTSRYYHHAIDWLRRVRDAYMAAGGQEDWQKYLSHLLTEHKRKYKLRAMLKDIKECDADGR